MRKTPHSLTKKEIKAIGGQCDSGEESNYEVGGGDSDNLQDGFPASCSICEADFTEPVITKCRHYFCEGCALRNYANDSNCFVCGQATDGVFNMARDLINHIKSKPVAQEPTSPKPEDDSDGHEIQAEAEDE